MYSMLISPLASSKLLSVQHFRDPELGQRLMTHVRDHDKKVILCPTGLLCFCKTLLSVIMLTFIPEALQPCAAFIHWPTFNHLLVFQLHSILQTVLMPPSSPDPPEQAFGTVCLIKNKTWGKKKRQRPIFVLKTGMQINIHKSYLFCQHRMCVSISALLT